MRGKLSLFLVLVAIAAAVYYWLSAPEAPPEYKTLPVKKGKIQAIISATGTLSAVTTVVIGSQVSGIVKAVYVDFNDTVTAGQLLAELDPASFTSQVEQAQAALKTALAQKSRADARLAQAKLTAARAEELSKKDLIAAADKETAFSELTTAQTELSIGDAQISEARSALRLAELAQSRTKIYSPINGVVISRKIDVGQTVAASLSAPELFSIAQDLKDMRVIADIAEADVGGLKEGMDATFTVDAFPGEDFHGTITQIRYSPTSQNGVVTYAAVISVRNDTLVLRPGMTANVEIVTKKKEDVLLIPNAALRFNPPSGGKDKDTTKDAPSSQAKPTPGTMRGKVYVKKGEQLESIPLVLGISDGKNTELISGDLTDQTELVTEVVGDKKRPSSSGLIGNTPRGTRF